ncbi:unnamed protein product [Peronospora belbahrii]|uniref:Nonsense-mediated mRNA decay factor SMG8 n=1 Tax=Peronospora belbahrii TaxID=622444 RepID=A0AAU9L0S0_9STRA|nr:unnamed protein product [Peronospora belbahrii]CAH0519737.1 unnamed protein product [Peronospora belbahrii]
MTRGRNNGRQSMSFVTSSRYEPASLVDYSQSEPVRLYPPEPGRGYLAALQLLQNKKVAIVGLLSTSFSSPSCAFAFANRLIGRCVFQDDSMQSTTIEKDVRLPASVHFYYDDVARCIYLLGVVRPESYCFCSHITSKDTSLKSTNKNVLLDERQIISDENTEEAEDETLSETQRIRHEVDTFQHEKIKMQVLLYTSCNILFVLKEDARMTIEVLRDIRALAAEKMQVLNLVPAPSKHLKRDSGHLKGSSASLSGRGNAFAPGRCVPLVVYVVPPPDNILYGSTKTQGSGHLRSMTVSYCKALETRLSILFRSLRSNTVGLIRMRDTLSAANLSKERRLFNLDPAHCVVVVSRRTVTADGRPVAQLENLLDAMDLAIDTNDIKDDSLLQSLANGDMGIQRLKQYLQKYLNLLFSFSPTSSKDGGRTELLSPSQWVKAFHVLAKDYNRMDSKRKHEVTTLENIQSAV